MKKLLTILVSSLAVALCAGSTAHAAEKWQTVGLQFGYTYGSCKIPAAAIDPINVYWYGSEPTPHGVGAYFHSHNWEFNDLTEPFFAEGAFADRQYVHRTDGTCAHDLSEPATGSGLAKHRTHIRLFSSYKPKPTGGGSLHYVVGDAHQDLGVICKGGPQHVAENYDEARAEVQVTWGSTTEEYWGNIYHPTQCDGSKPGSNGYVAKISGAKAKSAGVSYENLTQPQITGQPVVGSPLTANPGSWEPATTAFYYEWGAVEFASDTWTPLQEGTANTWVPRASDMGKTVAVRVRPANKEPWEAVISMAVTIGGYPPEVTTGTATVTARAATLSGAVNPRGTEVTGCQFEYGITASYGATASCSTPAGAGEAPVTETAAIGGLEPSTTYHFRLAATSSTGTGDGEDRTFKTPGWTIQSTITPAGNPTTARLFGISCWASNGCDAVGVYNNTQGEGIALVERWNGSTWEIQPTAEQSGAKQTVLEGVSCPSANECVATGYYEATNSTHHTLAESWNGSSWQLMTIPDKGTSAVLESVSCASAAECMTVGWYVAGSPAKDSVITELWNGTEWKIESGAKLPAEDEGSVMHGISCGSALACTAVGEVFTRLNGVRPLIESWNGSAWSLETAANPPHSLEPSLFGVSCASTTACTAVGHYKDTQVGGEITNSELHGERTLIERWDGTGWQFEESPSPIGKPGEEEHAHWTLSSVSCPSETSCIALGRFGGSETSLNNLLFTEAWNGASWVIDLPPERAARTNHLEDISCTGSTACTAVGFSQDGEPVGLDETLAERLE